jgi:hypothetical protein
VIGGGRSGFLPNSLKDYSSNINGLRIDDRNLVNEWIAKMEKNNKRCKFIWNATDFRSFDVNKYDHVLGNRNYK